jgi:polysaccharide export outer membrane protein
MPALLVVAIGLGSSPAASAAGPRIRRASQATVERKAPEPLKAPPSEVNEGNPASSPSTRLEVPSGSDVKITIEVLSKANPAAPAPVPAEEPPASLESPIPHPSKVAPDDPIWGMARIKPMPLAPIPDDPPPHEGAMAEHPYVIEPPDMIVVEVLEALPGRPISGERLVRPDGTISLGFYGELSVKGLTASQVKEKIILHLRKDLIDEVLGLIECDAEGNIKVVEPKDSQKVFVDVSAYNSKNYFIQGDVAAPGKLPHTGNETVLDALNYAGGLIPSADPKSIRLIRPSRGGKPARVYPVDLEAITERGESEKNYQIFPGDRLVVGRNAWVKTTIELDRVAGAMQTVTNTILQHSLAHRAVTQATSPPGTTALPALTPEQREALLKDWTDFWWKVVSRTQPAELDEKLFREALIRALNPPGTERPAEKP